MTCQRHTIKLSSITLCSSVWYWVCWNLLKHLTANFSPCAHITIRRTWDLTKLLETKRFVLFLLTRYDQNDWFMFFFCVPICLWVFLFLSFFVSLSLSLLIGKLVCLSATAKGYPTTEYCYEFFTIIIYNMWILTYFLVLYLLSYFSLSLKIDRVICALHECVRMSF